MARKLRIGAMAGLLASVSMTLSPAYAAELPSDLSGVKHNTLFTEFEVPQPGDSLSETQEWRRWGRWRGRGWRRGWRGRRGVRAGDVLAGVAIVGGIAAIASAANNNRRRDRDVVVVERDNRQDREVDELRRRLDEQQRELDYLRERGLDAERYRGRGTVERLPQSQLPQQRGQAVAPIGIDGAIDTCTDVVSRDARLSGIDGVERTAGGWSVRGSIESGEPFTCRVSNDGRIEALDYRDGFRSGQNQQRFERDNQRGYSARDRAPVNSAYPVRAEGQLSDDGYANARLAMAQRGDPREPLANGFADSRFADSRLADNRFSGNQSQALPAYPGGLVPGEVIPDTIDGDMVRDRRN